jgi:hypothetical protein
MLQPIIQKQTRDAKRQLEFDEWATFLFTKLNVDDFNYFS